MNDCIFCKIVKGEIKPKVVYEDQKVLAFPDVNPQAPLHFLIIPKKHIERLSMMEADDLPLVAEIHRAAQQIALDQHLDRGFRLVINNGSDAGQTVHHVHYHLLAGRKFGWPPG